VKKIINFSTTESDMQSELHYTEATLHTAFGPLAAELKNNYRRSGSRPYLVAIAGPPGCGKSAIASVLRTLLGDDGTNTTVLPMDGFHLRNSELASKEVRRGTKSVSLLQLKGARESYDTEALYSCIEKLRRGERLHWPTYSRITHEPIAEGIYLEDPETLYLIEGNYLLIEEHPWTHLAALFDRRIFIRPVRRYLRRRIIERKMRGGYGRAEAAAHFRRSDRHNIAEVWAYSKYFDYLLEQQGRYGYVLQRMKLKPVEPQDQITTR
jgi:pantothenate kinase